MDRLATKDVGLKRWGGGSLPLGGNTHTEKGVATRHCVAAPFMVSSLRGGFFYSWTRVPMLSPSITLFRLPTLSMLNT